MFKLQCECGNRIAVRSKHAGKMIHCIKCKRQIKVPDASASVRMIGVPRSSVDAKVWNAGPLRPSDQPASHPDRTTVSAQPSAPAMRGVLATESAAPLRPPTSPQGKADAVGGSLQFAPLFPVELPRPADQTAQRRQLEQPAAPSSAAGSAGGPPAADRPREAPAGLFAGDDRQLRDAAVEAASDQTAAAAGTANGPQGQRSATAGAVAPGSPVLPAHAAPMSWFDLPADEPPAAPADAAPVDPRSAPANAAAVSPAAVRVRGPLAKPIREPKSAVAASGGAPARLHLDGYLHQAAIDRRHRRARRLMLTVRLMIAAAVIVAVVVGVTLVVKELLRARAGSAEAVTFVMVNQAVAGSRATSLTVHLAFPGLEHDSYVLLEGDLDALAKAVPPLVIRHRIHHATIPSVGTSVVEDAQGRKRLSKVRYDLTPDEAAMLWEVPSATCVIGAMRFEMTPQTVHQMHWQAERYGYDIASPAQ